MTRNLRSLCRTSRKRTGWARNERLTSAKCSTPSSIGLEPGANGGCSRLIFPLGITFEWYDHKQQILPDSVEYASPVLVASPSSTSPSNTLTAILLRMVCPCAGG